MKTYSEKLKDPRWQRKRLEIMERDRFSCSVCCEDKSMLSVHHRYYITGRMPWEYPDWALITLCESCHKDRHDLDEAREEGSECPREDIFETVMGFLGAGVDVDESYIWDLAVEISMLGSEIGRDKAFSKAVHFLHDERMNSIK